MRKSDRLARIWSPEAKQDLFDIWQYITNESSPLIAEKILREIDHACFALGSWPEYGKARDEVREGIRSVSVARYVVFYRVMREAIQIVRVLDERRDVDAIFADDE